MIALALGALALFLVLGGGQWLAKARMADVKRLLSWVAGTVGALLAIYLVLTGKGAAALSAVIFLGPAAWNWWTSLRTTPATRGVPPRAAPSRGGMTQAEAYEVLGLAPGASEEAVRDAWLRLMRAAHPDNGGSDWLAARINQAHDVLMGKR